MTADRPRLVPGWRLYGRDANPQDGFDVAVILPTIGRDSAVAAVRSIYAQEQVGRIQVLIGVDLPLGDLTALHRLLEAAPGHVTPCLFYPGYSTAVRHGGLHTAGDGGALRTILSYLANARYLAYLDDDNWWHRHHLRSLLTAIRGRDWAFALRWFVHAGSLRPICVDDWESVGPERGVFRDKFGGWVDPNCLMIDKLACEPVLRRWSLPIPGTTMTADRQVYDWLQQKSVPGETCQPSVFYVARSEDVVHPDRLSYMGERYRAAEAP